MSKKNLIIGIVALIVAYGTGVLVGNNVIDISIGTGVLMIAGCAVGVVVGGDT